MIAVLKYSVCFFCVLQVVVAHAQENDSAMIIVDEKNVDIVKYTPEYNFKEGLYLNFEQVRKNSPVPLKYLVTSIELSDFYFFEKLLEMDKIIYFDQYGMKKEMKTNEIWGFCRKGNLFIRYNDEFNRIPIVGSICHFVANKEVRSSPVYDPYYNNYNNYRHDQPYNNTSTVMEQYILDFSTGEVYPFDKKSLMVILMKDPELYDEFNNLRKKQQRKKVYLYLRKFNQRNPLYMPK